MKAGICRYRAYHTDIGSSATCSKQNNLADAQRSFGIRLDRCRVQARDIDLVIVYLISVFS
ncbi:hypothetical protein C7A07_13060 [Pseudomonas fragi]|nr:hypothetical protein C7A07_13060 [Pseudomonas fragi]